MGRTQHTHAVARLVMDAETYSTVDLKVAGAHAYAEHPDTGVHCLAWKIVGGPNRGASGLWRPVDAVPGQPSIDEMFINHVEGGWTVVAHNWLFEWNIYAEILVPRFHFPPLSMAQMSCTMARALYHGLPAGLDELGGALGLTHVKDKTQRANMLKLAKPKRVAANGHAADWWHADQDPGSKGQEMLADLYRYCIADVEAEAEADSLLPELPPNEWETFRLDGRVNRRGIAVDLGLVVAMQEITDVEMARINAALSDATTGVVDKVSQGARLVQWLKGKGCAVPDLTKGSVEFALTIATDPLVRTVLRLRQDGARASTAKLRSMVAGLSRDGRARGLFQYYGAGRTGRWSGRRVQPQNYPRGTLKGTQADEAVGWIKKAGTKAPLDLFPGTTMSVMSSCLRGCLAAGPGNALVSVDLAQIEARVVAWLAGQQDLLDVFAAGGDVYTYTARKIGSDNRQLGKVLVLACGFGMGKDKFRETALAYGLALTAGQAEDYVTAWRVANPRIVEFWYALDRAFRTTVDSGGTGRMRNSVNGSTMISMRKTGAALRIVLPSGRELVYQQARVIPAEDSEDGPTRDSLGFMGTDSLSKKWCLQRTYGGKLAENITQAVARDVMRDALLRCDGLGLRAVGSIHDEGLFECPEKVANVVLSRALEQFRTVPSWSPGLPVEAEGWTGPRYRKG